MKIIRIIQIIAIAGLVLMLSDLAAAWSRQEHYRYYYPRYRDNYTIEDGWDLIKKDRSHTALDIFGDLAKSNPGAGGPRLGYAIAAADTNRLSESVWAMRRALQYHPGALEHFRLDLLLESKLKRLVSKYQGKSHGLPEKDT